MQSEIRRRQRIAAIVTLTAVVCILCALIMCVTYDRGHTAFDRARLVMRTEGAAVWS